MSEQLPAIPQSFEDKIKERLKKDIGDLIPDEALKTMVDKAIQDIFFKETVETSGYHSTKTPSWFHQEVDKLLHEKIKESMKSYVNDNKKELNKIIAEITVSTLPTISASVVTGLMTGNMQSLGWDIKRNIASMISDVMKQYQ